MHKRFPIDYTKSTRAHTHTHYVEYFYSIKLSVNRIACCVHVRAKRPIAFLVNRNVRRCALCCKIRIVHYSYMALLPFAAAAAAAAAAATSRILQIVVFAGSRRDDKPPPDRASFESVREDAENALTLNERL